MNGVIVGVEYAEIDDMSSYLGGTILITSGSFSDSVTIESGASSVTVLIPISECEADSGIYTVGAGFEVKTGGSFTEYSNYRITLQTELSYGDNGQETVQNSSISDYVVYTNAKVYPLVVVPPVED